MASKKKPVPVLAPDWKAAFQGHAMRSSFTLALTQPMLELLCAIADGVRWDRALYCQGFGVARPDMWLASSTALEKRGLIQKKSHAARMDIPIVEFMAGLQTTWVLTPAGEALVELLKVTGIFVEADAAIVKKLIPNVPKKRSEG